jgi:hypothetical protein
MEMKSYFKYLFSIFLYLFCIPVYYVSFLYYCLLCIFLYPFLCIHMIN